MPNCSENALKKMELDLEQIEHLIYEQEQAIEWEFGRSIQASEGSLKMAKKRLKVKENKLKKIKENPEVNKHYEQAKEREVREEEEEVKYWEADIDYCLKSIRKYKKLIAGNTRKIKTLEKRIRLCKEKNKTRILKRCPNGTRKNKDTGKCETIVEKLIDDMLYEYEKDNTNQRIINEKYQQIMEKTTKKKVSKSVLEMLYDILEENYEKKYYGTDFDNKLENIIKHNEN
jgi:hypothetical protein